MSNDKAQAAYRRTERPSFPTDAMTADERRALRMLEAEQAYRRNDGRNYPGWGPHLIAEFEHAERLGLVKGIEAIRDATHLTSDERYAAAAAKPAAAHVATVSRYNDGEPVEGAWKTLAAMLLGAAGIIAVGAGLYLELAALS